MSYTLNSIEEVIEDLKAGKPVIIVDDESRENEGDLVFAVEFATRETINFIIKEARGLLCTPMLEADLLRLGISQMVEKNTDNHETAFTVSVDYMDTTTGISPEERAITMQKLIDPNAKPEDFRRPGHVFPLRYKEGGVLVRQGHTEASIDLCKLAGLYPAAAICEITNDEGYMSRMDDLIAFSKKHNLKIASVEALVEYRKRHDKLVSIAAETKLPTKFGEFRIIIFKNEVDHKEHLMIVKGDVRGKSDVLMRIHSECLTGDVFGSHRCDCGEQLENALRCIEEQGEGIVIYMRQEGRGIGLTNKIKAYTLQDQGYDTVEANVKLGFPPDMREYSLAAQMLRELDVKSVKLLTNNPEKKEDLERWGITVSKRVPIVIKANSINAKYLSTKKEKMRHIL
ncbi:bifunctional 3,4-dihydroxy-2-butanone-4-phosphate synthase/GTP cyclohydrolase II [Veillonella sp. CHU740]|uniref:bifunctional 3,4-dihydroxy-2-butanone-4-phosphate synthase/GTP cyclohydrolase II n=1 Tax=Veillonella sp. CHU740 TaxID=2490950 RepID=UPI000F8E3AE4|nr:bifunctional 3,4-dihydroxy-2-butanone-4-phosphate synthase/GTP cyclohydrolase II [Veillonella sp. CHU740]